MTFREFAYLADENIAAPIVEALRRDRVDIVSVFEARLAATPDDEIIAFALEHKRIILTHDSDFGRQALSNRQAIFGIVFLRPGHANPEFWNEALPAILSLNVPTRIPFIAVIERRGTTVKARFRTPIA